MKHHRHCGILALLLGLSCILADSLLAQATNASITGRVVLEDGSPVPGATVLIEHGSTGFSSGAATGLDGRYQFLQLPLGGPYQVRVSSVGFATQTVGEVTLNQGDNVVLNFTMREETVGLDEITVSGQGFKSRNERLATSTTITPTEIRALPTSGRNYNSLLTLSPLIARGGNIFGNDGNMRGITLDGVSNKEASFGGDGAMPISMEVLREFEVVTNEYDVTFGRTGTGELRAVTKSGTNRFEGSAFHYAYGDRFYADWTTEGQATNPQTKRQFGATLGGPILRDRLHFFAAVEVERQDENFEMWHDAPPEAAGKWLESAGGLSRSGRISVEDMERVLAAGYQYYNVDPDQQQYGQFTRDRNTDFFFGRLDYQLSSKHRLTYRGTYSSFTQANYSNSDIARQAIFQSTYDFKDYQFNQMASMRSNLSNDLLNELRIGYYHHERGNYLTTGRSPQLWVSGTSTIEGFDEPQPWQVILRYNRWTPELQSNSIFTLIDNVYLTRGKYNFLFGTQNTITHSEGIYTHDTAGRFDFYSLEALEANRPDRFTRKHQNPGQELDKPVNVWVSELSGYGQVSTELLPHLTATAGLRYDVALFSTRADYNETLHRVLGYRNDTNPVDANNIQPRLHFNWDVNGRGRDIVNAGAGLFMGQQLTRPYIYSLIDNGIRFTQVDVRRDQLAAIGREDLMPVPDYDCYDSDYLCIPGNGITARDLDPSAGESQVVRFLDEDLQMPSAFKANAGYHRYLNDQLRVGATLFYNDMWNMAAMENVNLRRDAGFIDAEGREVYNDPAEMGAKGANLESAKISDEFGLALMYTNGPRQRFYGGVADLRYVFRRNGFVQVSYTRGSSRGARVYRNEDDQRYTGASYWDSYEFANRGYAGSYFKHKALINLVSPELLSVPRIGFAGVQVSGFMNAFRAGGFSATIARNSMDGSGVRSNDFYAAYIWDPEDPRTLELQGQQFVDDLRYVLDNAHPDAVAYLEKNMGTFAKPHQGLQPWIFETNVRIQGGFLVRQQRLTVSLDIYNLANFLSPGREGELRGWGGYDVVRNDDLYKVVAFDQATQTYKYEVNREFGQDREGKEGGFWSGMLGIKYTF